MSSLYEPNEAAKARFLAKFPDNRKGPLTNKFLEAVRFGIEDPCALVVAVCAKLKARIRHNAGLPYAETETLLLQTIEAFPDEAEAFAAHCIGYETLSLAQKEAYKQARQEENLAAWMQQQPPTEAQIKYARDLGFQGELTSKQHAKEVISTLKQGGSL